MENITPSLGDQFARLRGAAQAQEKCAWIPDAIHALIMACLARIFGRLEQIFQLWQAGALPPPPARAASRHQSQVSATRARARRPSASRRRNNTRPSIVARRVAAHGPAKPAAPATPAPLRQARHPARDPPFPPENAH